MGGILQLSKHSEGIYMGTLNAVNEWKRLRELYPAIESEEVKNEQDRKGNERSPQIRR